MTLLTKSACVLIGCVALLLGVAGSVSPARTAAWPPPLLAQASWTSDFSTGDFREWDWWGQGQDHLWGHIDVTTANEAEIPALSPSLPNVARMTVTRRDAASGRYHAKLYKDFERDGRPPADVSGTYSAWYYVPGDYSVPRGAWTNVFQFKEKYDGIGDPLWWIQIGTGAWARDMRRASWIGARPRRAQQPVAMLNRWNNPWKRKVVFQTVPLDRWFEIRAELHQGDRIDFFIDGRRFDTARAREYPVNPFHRGSQNWTFGVGNYSKAPGTTLYVGAASYRPAAVSSRTSAAGTPSAAPDASSP